MSSTDSITSTIRTSADAPLVDLGCLTSEEHQTFMLLAAAIGLSLTADEVEAVHAAPDDRAILAISDGVDYDALLGRRHPIRSQRQRDAGVMVAAALTSETPRDLFGELHGNLTGARARVFASAGR